MAETSNISQEDVDAAWDAEIARRIDDIDSGRVKTVPSSELWSRLGGKPNAQD